MESILEHTKLAIKMSTNKLDLKLIKFFPINQIEKVCNTILERNILKNQYEDNITIQKELIKDERFIDYLINIYQNDMDIEKFTNLIEEIDKHNENIIAYKIQDIINVLTNENLRYIEGYYYYLKYFSNYNNRYTEIISNNLNYFLNSNCDVKFEDLSKKEQELFILRYLNNYNLIPVSNIKEIYELLASNEDLREFINYLYEKELYLPLKISSYNKINTMAKDILAYIKEIYSIISDSNIIYQILLKWISMGCNLYDLKIIDTRIKKESCKNYENIFSSRSSYINYIYGDKLKKFPLNSIMENPEDIIIYAINHNKTSFLNLIENNIHDFLSIPSNSIIYDEDFYNKYVNINELTLKHLAKLKEMPITRYSRLNRLKEQIYTFEEISTLYNADLQYILLYNELLDLRIDERLLRIRQFLKKGLLSFNIEETEMKILAEKIKLKPVYKWLENDFNHIANISAKNVVRILINYEQIEKFIKEIKTDKELDYLLRNINIINNYNSLDAIKSNIEQIDKYWTKLKEELEFSKDFLEKYRNNIQEFLLNNGAELAYKYWNCCNSEQKKSFKLIVKSELMGEFKQLKYHMNDLSKEIDCNLNDKQVIEWTKNNSELQEGKYSVGEYDDFYSTMILGECPQRTCLSYKDGMYNKCLLACFDSNKKILYAKINDKIVARAMLRLTKGTYNLSSKNNSLSFVDVEKAEEIQESDNKKEYLTIFLEKSYIAGMNEIDARNIFSLFMKLLEKKAENMNALLVLSNYYSDYTPRNYVTTRYYMYISKSKSSSQYLDSLEGQATINDECQYKANKFLIFNKN